MLCHVRVSLTVCSLYNLAINIFHFSFFIFIFHFHIRCYCVHTMAICKCIITSSNDATTMDKIRNDMHINYIHWSIELVKKRLGMHHWLDFKFILWGKQGIHCLNLPHTATKFKFTSLLSHPGIPGVTLCFCTCSYAAAGTAAAGRRFLSTR